MFAKFNCSNRYLVSRFLGTLYLILLLCDWLNVANAQTEQPLVNEFDFLVYVQPVSKHTETAPLEIVYRYKKGLFRERKEVQKLYFNGKYFLFSAFQLTHLIKAEKPNCLMHAQLTESNDFKIIYYQVAGMDLKHGDIYDIHYLDRRITCLKSLHAWTLKYGAKAKHKIFRKIISTINQVGQSSNSLRSEVDFLQDLKEIILKQSDLRVIPINKTIRREESNGYINRHLQHLIEESAIDLARFENRNDKERRLLELQYETLNNELRELKLIEKDLTDGTNYTGQAYVPIEIYDPNQPDGAKEQYPTTGEGKPHQVETRDEEAAEALNDFLGD